MLTETVYHSPECISEIQKILTEVQVVAFDMDGTLYERTPEMDNIIQSTMADTLASFFHTEQVETQTKFQEIYNNPEQGKFSGTKTATLLIEQNFASNKPSSRTIIEYANDLISASPDIPGLTESLNRNIQDGQLNSKTFAAETAKAIIAHALNIADVISFIKNDPNIVTLIRQISNRGKAVGVITSSPSTRAISILTKLGFDPVADFSFIISSQDASKHDGTAYDLLASKYPHINSGQILMIGDSHSLDVAKANEHQFLGIQLAQDSRQHRTRAYESVTISNRDELRVLFRLDED